MRSLVVFVLVLVLALPRGWAAADSGPVVILGDSLTAGLGVLPEQAYPALIQKMLDRKRAARINGESLGTVRVINGGISGSTSAGAHARLKWYLQTNPRLVVLALGANDGLRGLPVREMKKNLARAIDLAKSHRVPVILCGMAVPPNYGAGYARDFRQVFSDLARDHDIPLIPFLLEGVAGRPRLNQAYGIHPSPEGHEIIARHVFPYILESL